MLRESITSSFEVSELSVWIIKLAHKLFAFRCVKHHYTAKLKTDVKFTIWCIVKHYNSLNTVVCIKTDEDHIYWDCSQSRNASSILADTLIVYSLLWEHSSDCTSSFNKTLLEFKEEMIGFWQSDFFQNYYTEMIIHQKSTLRSTRPGSPTSDWLTSDQTTQSTSPHHLFKQDKLSSIYYTVYVSEDWLNEGELHQQLLDIKQECEEDTTAKAVYEMTDIHKIRVNKQLTGNMTDLIMNSEI